VTTRRLRVVKYRGTAHGTNEYPFLIDEDGFSVLPITSAGLVTKRPTSGSRRGSRDWTRCWAARGSTAAAASSSAVPQGTGKSSIAAHLAVSRARGVSAASTSRSRSRRARSSATWRPSGSIFILGIKKGLLRFVPGRPTANGLEMHLALMTGRSASSSRAWWWSIRSATRRGGDLVGRETMLMRLIDLLKTRADHGRAHGADRRAVSTGGDEVGILALIDTWLLCGAIELGGRAQTALST
jgi:circadian clock protein KaiC